LLYYVVDSDLQVQSTRTDLPGCVESGSIREHQGVSGIKIRDGVSGVPDIREPGPTGYPGYLRDIRDISGIGIRDGGIRFPP
jgi:hypothetical protein